MRALAADGADFLKVYNSVPRDAFLALMEEARAAGIPVAGHVPEEVSPLEASAAGIRSEEHLNNILLNASTDEVRLRRERVAMMYDPKITGAQRLRLLAWPMLAGLVDTYDEKKAAAVFQAFVKNGTWQTPTLAILDGFVHELDDEFVNDPRRRFLPKVWTDNWDPRVIYYLRDESPAEYEVLHQRMRMLLTRYRKLVGDMHRAGVELLAGTDTNPLNPVLPGWGLHQELVLLAGVRTDKYASAADGYAESGAVLWDFGGDGDGGGREVGGLGFVGCGSVGGYSEHAEDQCCRDAGALLFAGGSGRDVGAGGCGFGRGGGSAGPEVRRGRGRPPHMGG